MEAHFGWGREEGGWRKGPWTAQEDRLLLEYVRLHGEGRWNSVSKLAGLKRSGKSCRLRWVNYLRPDLKRGRITPQEESVILEQHALWGNRWSTIARSLPGRTDNEIKNYWRTHSKKGKPPSRDIERARARFLKQRRETQSQLLLRGQEPPPQQQQLKQPDHDNAVTGEAAPAAVSPEKQRDDHLQAMLVMDDDMLYKLCPMSMSSCSPSYLLHGGSVNASAASSEDQLDGGDTWGRDRLWNLDDVVDDVDGGWGSSCPWLQDQGLAFF